MRISTTKGNDLDILKALKLYVRRFSNWFNGRAVVTNFVDGRQ
jgi:hypothetical protein